MTEAQYLCHMFGVATGWLGWSPEIAWNCTVPEINTAIAARVEFIQMTTPGMTPKKSPKAEKASPMSSFINSIVKMKGTQVHGR